MSFDIVETENGILLRITATTGDQKLVVWEEPKENLLEGFAGFLQDLAHHFGPGDKLDANDIYVVVGPKGQSWKH